MWALLLAIVVVGIVFVAVGTARRELQSKREPTGPQHRCCTPCRHSCQHEHP